MSNVLVIRHLSFEDLGHLGPLLEERGHQVRFVEAGQDDLGGIDSLSPDLLVVLGGPIGVYEEENYPFLTTEIALLQARLAAKRPTLGLCLGAQLMARALGARVYFSGRKEIGWAPLTLSKAGLRSPLRHLTSPVLHWHGDTFDLPAGAEHLASTAQTLNQAFAVEGYGLGLQFHPEVTAAGLERWYIGHACEISGVPGLSVPALRAAAARHAGALAKAGRACFTEWLESVGL